MRYDYIARAEYLISFPPSVRRAPSVFFSPADKRTWNLSENDLVEFPAGNSRIDRNSSSESASDDL